MTSQEQAQSPFNPNFARLGRSVWFTLESSQRADPKRVSRLEAMLDIVGDQIESMAGFSLSWLQAGDWSKRRDWNDEKWVAFMRTFQYHGGNVFMGDDTSAEEKVLFESLLVYYKYYVCLPGLPEVVPESATGCASGNLSKSPRGSNGSLQCVWKVCPRSPTAAL